MTFLTIITFNQLQLKSLVCMASPLLPSWAVSQRNLLTFQATPGTDSGSPSACLWPWSEATPLSYSHWPVCMFDLILFVPLESSIPVATRCLLWANPPQTKLQAPPNWNNKHFSPTFYIPTNVEKIVAIHHPPLKQQLPIISFLSRWISRCDLLYYSPLQAFLLA